MPAFRTIAFVEVGIGILAHCGGSRHGRSGISIRGKDTALVEGENFHDIRVASRVPAAVRNSKGYELLILVGNAIGTLLLRIIEVADVVLVPLGVVGHVSGHGCSGSIAICIGPSGKEVALTSGIVAKTGCRIIAVDRDLLVGEHLIFFDAIGVDYRVG